MKEFKEKLIGRLEGREKYYHECALDEIMTNGHTLDAEGFLGKEDAYGDAISIINQLAEEYNNDFCEWTEISVGGITAVKEPHRMKLLNCDHEQKFCPYCGKKIKIALYQPKGE